MWRVFRFRNCGMSNGSRYPHGTISAGGTPGPRARTSLRRGRHPCLEEIYAGGVTRLKTAAATAAVRHPRAASPGHASPYSRRRTARIRASVAVESAMANRDPSITCAATSERNLASPITSSSRLPARYTSLPSRERETRPVPGRPRRGAGQAHRRRRGHWHSSPA